MIVNSLYPQSPPPASPKIQRTDFGGGKKEPSLLAVYKQASACMAKARVMGLRVGDSTIVEVAKLACQ
jgi:hypothetical protein